ncbi:MAG: HD domain-containing protein [Elusimicrobia bacterium]|nr:HD domain-containing protein [Elusimicrobiota bacterium]
MASRLALALLLSAAPVRAAVIASLPASSLAAPVVGPAAGGWASAFDAFAQWGKTPAGRSVIVAADPALVALVGIHPEARAIAVGPLSERLPAQWAGLIAGISGLPKEEQLAAAQAVSQARSEAAPEAEPKVVMAWELAKARAVAADMGEFRAFTEQLKGLAVYGPQARAAYKASKRVFIERAMRNARRVARELEPIDWDSGLYGSAPADAPSQPPTLEAARLLSTRALPPASFYDPAHWRPASVPDRRYARRLDAASTLLGMEDRQNSPELARIHQARMRLLDTLRAKDASVYAHLMRVGLMAGLIAWRMGFSMDYAQRVAWGARAHDIGKRDDEILAVVNKPGRLTPEERKIMERHTLEGDRILREEADPELDSLSRRVGRRAAVAHHETLDGRGYPHGLKEGEIPMEARITAVVDFFDALMENRPYRPGMTVEKALAIMEPNRDKFDPSVWRAFREVVDPAPPAPR